jgi:aminomethyltransferase
MPAQALLQKTPLHALHLAHGGKMVPFAGYDMPVQYEGLGVLKEHLHTRHAAGLFDVSHMGQATLSCKEHDPAALLEKIVPGDIAGLADGQMRYTVLLNDQGGIVDDMMVTRIDDRTLFLVVNAACKEKDFAFLRQHLGAQAHLDHLAERALLALQGPAAEEALKTVIPEAAKLAFMHMGKFTYKGRDVYVSRSSYAGEDGFEISVPGGFAEALAQDLLMQHHVKLIGLGARDSLRLEAGLCLYGHDIDDTTTPAEANLKWIIPKRRRGEANFPAAQKILAQIENGTARLRVGIQPEGRAPVREGTELFSADGRRIGVVTSGGFGPTVNAPVAMGYVEQAFAAPGTQINALLRGAAHPCAVVTLPFVKHTYKK